MLLFQVFGVLALATTTFAQNFNIGSPASGQTLFIGQTFTVEIDQPVLQGPFQSVSVVISLQDCGITPCTITDNDVILGEILFSGNFSPQRHESFKPPYQNFTLDLAGTIQPGSAVLHVVQLYLNGAGPSAGLATRNVSVLLGPTPGAKRLRSSRSIRI